MKTVGKWCRDVTEGHADILELCLVLLGFDKTSNKREELQSLSASSDQYCRVLRVLNFLGGMGLLCLHQMKPTAQGAKTYTGLMNLSLWLRNYPINMYKVQVKVGCGVNFLYRLESDLCSSCQPTSQGKCCSFWTRLYQLHSEGWSSWHCLFFDMQLCLPASRQTIKFLSASAPDRLFSFCSISLKFDFKLFHTTFAFVISVNAVGMQTSVVLYSSHPFHTVLTKSLYLL